MPATELPYFDENSHPAGRAAALRIWDAAANRAGEALRVIEDFARFALDDALLTERTKTMRHDLAQILAAVPPDQRLRARQTESDVGTEISTPSESQRPDIDAVLRAAFQRLEQSLRSLEEYGKVVAPEAAPQLEQLRYRTYTLEPAIYITREIRERLASMRLCVLVEGCTKPEECEARVRVLLDAGVSAVQLRDKKTPDRHLLACARRLREVTLTQGALLIVNDRPDLAIMSRADGLHLGQGDVTIADARKLVGPEMLIGISTHSLAQAEDAAMAGADYIGVGPMFRSSTKEFEEYPGPPLMKQVSERVSLPALAIGGITPGNLEELLEAGARRIAVGQAITRAEDPAATVREFLSRLQLPTGVI